MKHAYLLYTGYGKTKLSLDLILNMPIKPRTLLISTRNIIESGWQDEIDKWHPGALTYNYITGNTSEKERLEILEQPMPDLFGINTEMLEWYISNTCSIKSKRIYKNEVRVTYNTEEILERYNMLIVDESSLFKNSTSERFKLLKKFAYKMEHVILLTATPKPRSVENFWSQIYLLDGGKRLGKTITKFRQTFGIPVPLPNGHTRWDYSNDAVDMVLKEIKDIVTSIPAPDEPLFPEPIIKRIMIKPDGTTAKYLEYFKKYFVLKLPKQKQIVAFSQNQLMRKINQIANGAVYDKDVTHHINKIKLWYITEFLKTIDTPVMITYLHVFNKEQLLKLPGAVLLDNKQAFKDWNQNKIKIGIISPFSASHGLNLQHSNSRHLIWFSPIWDTEKWIQMNARMCRRGQQNQVEIMVLLLEETFEAYAFKLCQDKFRSQYNTLQKLR